MGSNQPLTMMISRNLDDDSITLPQSHFDFQAPDLDSPHQISRTSISRTIPFSLPVVSISSLTLPASICVSPHIRPIATPFPFNAQPLLLRELSEEYRHYFRIPGGDHEGFHPKNRGAFLQPIEEQSSTVTPHNSSKEHKKSFLKRACKSFRKKFTKLVNFFPPVHSDLDRVRDNSEDLEDFEGPSRVASSRVYSAFSPPNLATTYPGSSDPPACGDECHSEVVTKDPSYTATIQLINELKLSVAHIEEDTRRLAHILKIYRQLAARPDFVLSDELRAAIAQLPDTLLPCNSFTSRSAKRSLSVPTMRGSKSCSDLKRE